MRPRDQCRVILAPPAASPTASTGADTGTGAPDANAGTAPFHVDVTNQSYEEPRVPLVVSIDDETVIDDSFDVDDQHTVKRFDLRMAPGDHLLVVHTPATSLILRYARGMRTITATEASRRFSDLLDAIERGETITITRGRHPIAEIGPARRRTGADLRAALTDIAPPDERFADDIADALALVTPEERDPWADA